MDGLCFGGGIELLSLFDFVTCTPASIFGLWQRKNGLSFGWGGRERLEAIIGPAAVREWYLSASLKSAYEACNLGLIHNLEMRQLAKARSLEWLEDTANLRPETLELHDSKKLSETEVFEKLWGNEDHQKSLSRYRKD